MKHSRIATKLLTVLFSASLTLSSLSFPCFSTTVHAAPVEENSNSSVISSGDCGDYLTWTLDDDGKLMISGVGSMSNWVYDDNSPPWKDFRSDITSVIISDEITNIGYCAFYNCTNLTSVTLPESLTVIGAASFENCTSLTSITIPEYVELIDVNAFFGCANLISVNIPESVEYIEDHAFDNCPNLDPENIIFVRTFNGFKCALTIEGTLTITGSGRMPLWDYDNNCPPWKDYRRDITSVIISDEITDIGYCAFYNCTNLTSVTLPESLTVIGAASFENCTSLTSITIPEYVESIDVNAFFGCENLASVTIPYGVGSICENAFANCSSLNSVVLNKLAYSEEAFLGLSADVFHFYYDVTYSNDGHGSFSGKTRTYGTDVVELTITPDNGFVLDTVTWTDGNRTVELTTNNDGKYTMPDSENVIFLNATFKSSGISETYIAGGTCGDNITWSLDTEGTLKIVGEGDMPHWVSSPVPWDDYRENITSVEISDGITSIGENAFASCSNLINITIPDGVTSIGEAAFCCCINLTNIRIPEGVVVIEDYTFASCESLTSVSIPEGVTSLGFDAFANCTGLNEVIIPNSMIVIGSCAFFGCANLNEIKIPENVSSIEYGAFGGCTNLKEIKISENVSSIEYGAFDGCSNLNSVVISKNVYSNEAFLGVPADVFHFYYDVTYSNDGHGVISGKTRTYGTENVELSIVPDDGFVIDKVTWNDGNQTLELTPDTDGKYTMPDSATDVVINSFDGIVTWNDGNQTVELTPDTNGKNTIADSETGVEIKAYFKCAVHIPVTDVAVDPDCTNTGLTEGSHCSVCGEVIVAQEEIPAKGHTLVTDEAVEPGYDHTGLTEGSHCSDCGEVIVAQEVIPALKAEESVTPVDDPIDESSEPSEDLAELEEEPEVSGEQPEEPTIDPADPVDESSEPSEDLAELEEEPEVSGEQPEEPTIDPADSVDEPTEPSEDLAELEEEPEVSGEQPEEPTIDPADPVDEPSEPSENPTEPEEEPVDSDDKITIPDVSVSSDDSTGENASDNNSIISSEAENIIDEIVNGEDPNLENVDFGDKDPEEVKEEVIEAINNGDTFYANVVAVQQFFEQYADNWGQIKQMLKTLNAQFEGAYNIEVQMCHMDKKGDEHHIGNIIQFEDELTLTFELPLGMKNGQAKKYILVRVHKNADGTFDYSPIDYVINSDGTFTFKSDMYSDFIFVSVDVEENEELTDDTAPTTVPDKEDDMDSRPADTPEQNNEDTGNTNNSDDVNPDGSDIGANDTFHAPTNNPAETNSGGGTSNNNNKPRVTSPATGYNDDELKISLILLIGAVGIYVIVFNKKRRKKSQS